MPITVTFDLPSTIDNNDRTRIRLAFQRLGWETIGGTAYRYPPLANPGPAATEDWLNRVVPALMFLRCLIAKNTIQMSNFTVDATSSAGFRQGFGADIQASSAIQMTAITTTDDPILSEQRLRDWLEECDQAAPP